MADETKLQAGQAVLPCSAEVMIPNMKGLHARASAQFVKCAERFDANVQVTREGQTVPGTSIMGLMMLAASTGCELELRAQGAEAARAIEALAQLVADKFDEE